MEDSRGEADHPVWSWTIRGDELSSDQYILRSITVTWLAQHGQMRSQQPAARAQGYLELVGLRRSPWGTAHNTDLAPGLF